jgi:hypothetical protein
VGSLEFVEQAHHLLIEFLLCHGSLHKR